MPMTTEMLNRIEILVPGRGHAAELLRQVVRLLADAGGALFWGRLTEGTKASQAEIVEAAWDWSGLERGYGTLRLATWLRRELGLPWPAGELRGDLGGPEPDEPTAYHRPTVAGSLRRVNDAAGEQARSLTHNKSQFVRLDMADCEQSTPEQLAASTEIRRQRLAQQARQAGYDGDPCPRCHERRIVHSGSLYCCDNCQHRWTEAVPVDRLSGVREALAGCTNISSFTEGMTHAYGLEVFEPAILPRDCPGVAT